MVTIGRPTAPDLAPVRAQWDRGERQAEALTGAAEAAAEEWRFTKSGTYRERDLQPLWREREGAAGGRLIASPPRSKDHDAYGLDSDGRVVLVRGHYGGETSLSCVHFEPALAEGYDYDGRGRLLVARRYTMADQRVIQLIIYSRGRFGEESWRRECYEYGLRSGFRSRPVPALGPLRYRAAGRLAGAECCVSREAAVSTCSPARRPRRA